jgi:hypothetical protein
MGAHTYTQLPVGRQHSQCHDVESLSRSPLLIFHAAAHSPHEHIVEEGKSGEGSIVEQVPVECLVVVDGKDDRVQESKLAEILLRQLAKDNGLLFPLLLLGLHLCGTILFLINQNKYGKGRHRRSCHTKLGRLRQFGLPTDAAKPATALLAGNELAPKREEHE